jgi:hypothetical protein
MVKTVPQPRAPPLAVVPCKFISLPSTSDESGDAPLFVSPSPVNSTSVVIVPFDRHAEDRSGIMEATLRCDPVETVRTGPESTLHVVKRLD